jgi:cell division septation protein DedD
VIFLCGVLVGRGVRAERGTGNETAALSEPSTVDAARETSGAVIAPGQDPTVAPAPPPPAEDSGFSDRSNKPAAAVEPPKTIPPTKPDTAPPVEKPGVMTAPPPKEPPAAAAAPVSGGAPAPGFAVQVAALNVRSEADAIARRLSAKGYSAYVQPPASGKPTVFRVRVGTFKTKREADTVAARLKKEEKFTPWVTR